MSASPTTSPLRPGATFGRYEIVRPLGAGGMGAVFEAVHNELGKRVAIKALLPQLAERDDVRARMLREGKAAAQIRHPNVVDIFDVGSLDGITYLVMELLEGEDLGQRLKRVGHLGREDAIDVMLPVLAGLSAAHAHGVLHRDLKPANIFLTRGPHGRESPKILDFGIAKTLTVDATEALTTTGAIIGTPHYMSPEQVGARRDIDGRADLYSLGVILYHCLAGRAPFSGNSMYAVMNDVVNGRFEPLTEIEPGLPPELGRVVAVAMAKDPDARFDSAIALGAALLPFASDRARVEWAEVFGDMPSSVTERALPISAFAADPADASVVDTHLPLRAAGVPSSGRRWVGLVLALLVAGGLGAAWLRWGPATTPPEPVVTPLEGPAAPKAVPEEAAPAPSQGPAAATAAPKAEEPAKPEVAPKPTRRPARKARRRPSPATTTAAPRPEPTRAPARTPSLEAPAPSPLPTKAPSPTPRRTAPPPPEEPDVELGTNDAPILR